jgi:hypothetical protein
MSEETKVDRAISANGEPHRFYTKRKEIKIQIDDEEYTIRSMSGQLRDEYMQSLHNRSSNVDGVVRVTKIVGFNTELLTRCLHKDNKLVKAEDIQKWDAETIEQIFQVAQDFNAVDKDARDKAKNDLQASI